MLYDHPDHDPPAVLIPADPNDPDTPDIDILPLVLALGNLGYRVQWIGEGEARIHKPHRYTRTHRYIPAADYTVSLTGRTFSPGCTCPAGQWGQSCKHKRIVLYTRPCPRPDCGGMQLFQAHRRPDGTENSYYRCFRCGYIVSWWTVQDLRAAARAQAPIRPAA